MQKCIVDIDDLVLKCMMKSSYEPLTARTVTTYLNSPFAVHCEKFVSKDEKDKISEYDRLLFKKGKDHEKKIVHEKYPNVVSISYETPEIGFRSTIESMILGDETLHSMPMYYLPNGVYGIPDIVEKSNTENSIFGDYHYTVTEVKLAKNIKQDHLIQGAFYNYVLGAIQGITPDIFCTINGEGEKEEHDYRSYEPTLMSLIGNTRKILQEIY